MGSVSRSRSRSGSRSPKNDDESRSPSPAPKRTVTVDEDKDKDSKEKDRRRSRSSSSDGSRHGRHSKKDDSTGGKHGDDDEKKERRTRRHSSGSNRSVSKERDSSKRKRSRTPERRRTSRSPERTRRSSRRSRSRSRSRSYSPRNRGGDWTFDDHDQEEGYRLHVADLDSNATKRDLEKVFGKFGPLKEIWMARSVPCFAFVVYRYREDAEEAQRKVDSSEISGRRVRVTVARPRTKGRGRRGFDPNMRCYQCGERGHFSRDCPDSKYGYKRPPSPSRRSRDYDSYSSSRHRGHRF